MKKVFSLFLVIILICIPFFQISNADILSELEKVDENTEVHQQPANTSIGDDFGKEPTPVEDSAEGILATILKILMFVPKWLLSAVIGVIIWALPSITGIVYGTSATFQINYFDSAAIGISGGLLSFVSRMYTALRYLAMVIYVIMIAYLAIRMLISSIGKQKAMYKALIKNWFTGLLLLGAGHYIMAFVIWLANLITTLFYNIAYNFVTKVMPNIGGITPDFHESIPYFLQLSLLNNADLASLADLTAMGTQIKLITAIVFIGILCAVMWTYVKRLFIVTYLMIIYPLVSVTYVFDKIGDRKAQSMQFWFREFASNVFTQPIHAILLSLILLAMASCNTAEIPFIGGILGLIMLMFLFKGEELLKKVFQLNSSMGGADFGRSGAGLLGAMHAVNSGIKKGSELKQAASNYIGYRNFLSKNGLNAKSSSAAQLAAAKKMGVSEEDFKKMRKNAMEGKNKMLGAFAGSGSALFAFGAGGNARSMATGFALGDAAGQSISAAATASTDSRKFNEDMDKLVKDLKKINEGLDNLNPTLDDLPEIMRKKGESDQEFEARKEERKKKNKERAELRKKIGKKLGVNPEALKAMKTDDIEKYLDMEKDIFAAKVKYGDDSAVVKAMEATKTLNSKKGYSDADIGGLQYAQDDKNGYLYNKSTGEMTVLSGKGNAKKYEDGEFSGWHNMPKNKEARDQVIRTEAFVYARDVMSTKYKHLIPDTKDYNDKFESLYSDYYKNENELFGAIGENMNASKFYESSEEMPYTPPTPTRRARATYETMISNYLNSGHTDVDFTALTNNLQALGISLDNIREVLSNKNPGSSSEILDNLLKNRNFVDSSLRAYNYENLHNPNSVNINGTSANIMSSLNDGDRQAIIDLGSSNLRFDTTMNSGGDLETVVTNLDDPTKFVVVKPDKDIYANDFVVPTSSNEVVTTAGYINDSGEIMAAKGAFAKTSVSGITQDYVAGSDLKYDLSVVGEGIYSGLDEMTVVRQGKYQTVLDKRGKIIHSTEVTEDIGNAAQEVHLIRDENGTGFSVDGDKSGMLSRDTMKKVQIQVVREKMGQPTSATEYYADEMVKNWDKTLDRYDMVNKK